MTEVLKRVLPWLVTTLVLAFIAVTTDLETAWATVRATNWVTFVPAVIAVCVTVFLFDSWCLVRLFSRFVAPVTFKEMLPLKGTSYFLNVINYNAAAAGIALFFRNKKGVPFLEALASMLWLNFIDIVALAALVLLGMWVSPVELDPKLAFWVTAVCSGVLVILVGSCIYWNGRFDWFFFGRFRSWTIFASFAKARLPDYAFFIGIRIAFVGTYVVSQAVSMPFFSLDAGIRELFLFVPLLTFVGTIPFTTIAGLGTVQVLMRSFYEPFTPTYPSMDQVHAHIDAYSTTTILAFVLVRIAIGAVFMRGVSMKIQAQDPAGAVPDAADPVRTNPS